MESKRTKNFTTFRFQAKQMSNFRDIPLRPCGTSSYSSEIAEAFITVYASLTQSRKAWKLICNVQYCTVLTKWGSINELFVFRVSCLVKPT